MSIRLLSGSAGAMLERLSELQADGRECVAVQLKVWAVIYGEVYCKLSPDPERITVKYFNGPPPMLFLNLF